MKLRMLCKSRLPSRIRTRESGQSLIELALVLPVFFLMTLGFIDFCLILFNMGNANFASRAAVRYASTHSLTSYLPLTQSGLNNLVSPYIYGYPSNTYSVSAKYYANFTGGGTNVVGEGVCINITVTYPLSIFNKTYKPISYSSMGCSIMLQ